MGDWLEALQADLLAITTEAARPLWPGPDGRPWFNYRWEHALADSAGRAERDAAGRFYFAASRAMAAERVTAEAAFLGCLEAQLQQRGAGRKG